MVGALLGIHNLEEEHVLCVGVAHGQVEAVCVFLQIEQNAVFAILHSSRDGEVAVGQLLDISVQLIFGIDRAVEWAVERAATYHRHDGEKYDGDYSSHLSFFSI